MLSDRLLPSLLNDIANFSLTDDAVGKIAKKWPDLVKDLKGLPAHVVRDMAPHDPAVQSQRIAEIARRMIGLNILIRRVWMGAPPDAVQDFQRVLFPRGSESRVEIDWRRQALSYQPQTTVEQVLYYLLQHSSLAKICGNTECTRPLFLAERPNERYCSNGCFDEGQRLSTAKWWREHGTAWRTSRRSSTKGKVQFLGPRSTPRKAR
jgi:hypothetical protein